MTASQSITCSTVRAIRRAGTKEPLDQMTGRPAPRRRKLGAAPVPPAFLATTWVIA
jgi:hypothetical protein